jgi:transcriptional regulator with XRE-family HTH domain
MDTFFFDHLPLHPPPESDESLTGYLRRLASVNGIPSVNSLAMLADTPLNYLIGHPDIPLNDYQRLARLSAQPEASLRDRTFQHLMTKFGRGDAKQRAGPFLNHALAFQVRYCPQCLADSLHYRLVWRFQFLSGCPHHGCGLIEVCPGCGKPMPLFSAPFDLNRCPHCEVNLLEGEARCLTAVEHEAAITAYHELTFLLTPHDGSVDRVAQALGPQLAALRKQAQVQVSDMAARLGTTSERVKGLESRDSENRRGVNLEHYLKYAAVLDLRLRDVFLDLVQKDQDSTDLATVTRTSLYEDFLLERA